MGWDVQNKPSKRQKKAFQNGREVEEEHNPPLCVCWNVIALQYRAWGASTGQGTSIFLKHKTARAVYAS